MPEDLLKLMFRMQKKFQDKFRFYVTRDRIVSAMMHECGELWEASYGKWWSKRQYSKAERVEEVVDLLHFFLNYCIAANISPEELFNAYSKKLAENYRRQKRGY